MKIMLVGLMVVLSALANAEDNAKVDVVVLHVHEENIDDGVVVIDKIEVKVEDAKVMISNKMSKTDKVKILYSSGDKREGGLHEWIKKNKSDRLVIEYGKMAHGGW